MDTLKLTCFLSPFNWRNKDILILMYTIILRIFFVPILQFLNLYDLINYQNNQQWKWIAMETHFKNDITSQDVSCTGIDKI